MKDIKALLVALEAGLLHQSTVGKVLIIGAGMAGLTAAQILAKSGVEVQILEATARYGGRIFTLTNFATSPVEAGAEEVHGGKTALAFLAEMHQKELVNQEGNHVDFYYFENKLWQEQEAYARHDFATIDNFYSLLEEADFSDTEGFISVQQFLDAIDSPKEFRHILEARISNSYGASVAQLDAREMQKNWEKWTAGDVNFTFETAGYIDLCQAVFADVLPQILYQKPITQLAYQANKVKATTPNGEIFEADAVVLTASLGVLKKELIAFSPRLPEDKINAIESIGIGAGLKIILKFQCKFWGDDAGALYGDGYVSEFYPSAKNDEAILTALVMGEKAQYLSDLGEEKAIELALQELDKMCHSDSATRLYKKGRCIDWTTMPFQWGAYSYPTFTCEQARINLAMPLPPLYFAGEATHTEGHAATVHGAMETGYRAAKEVLGL